MTAECDEPCLCDTSNDSPLVHGFLRIFDLNRDAPISSVCHTIVLTFDMKIQLNEWQKCFFKVHHQKGGHRCCISGLKAWFPSTKSIMCV